MNPVSAGATTQESSKARRLTLLLSDEGAATIRAQVFAGFKAGQTVVGGAEVGGVLTKKPFRGDSISMVNGFESVPCEYLYGPFYRLSPADVNTLRYRIRNLEASGTQKIVGLFRSSTRESFGVAPEDIAIVREVMAGTAPIFIAKPAAEGKCTLRVFWPGNDQSWLQFEEFDLPNTFVAQQEP